MLITHSAAETNVCFEDLYVGDLFYVISDSKRNTYLKIYSHTDENGKVRNCVDLDSLIVRHLEPHTAVFKYENDSELILK